MAGNLRKRGIRNELKGTRKKVAGRVRNAAGALTGETRKQIRGKAKELEGGAQKAIGTAQRRLAEKRGARKPRDTGAAATPRAARGAEPKRSPARPEAAESELEAESED